MAALRSGAHQVFVDDLLVRLDAEPRLLGQVRDAVADDDGAFGEAAGDFTCSTQYSMTNGLSMAQRKCSEAAVLMSVVKLWLQTLRPRRWVWAAMRMAWVKPQRVRSICSMSTPPSSIGRSKPTTLHSCSPTAMC